MFNKSFLIDKIVNSLLAKEFEVFLTRGCFEIAAKRERLMLIKSLINVDGLNREQALSLRAISYFLSACPFVVSMKNNREFLSNGIIYSRFALPVVTPRMFESILTEEAYSVQSAKGRHTVSIDASALKQTRKERGFTLEELSQLIGISKKALYEIENERVNPTIETAKKLERFLKLELKTAYEPQTARATYVKPQNSFQSKVSKEFARIGIDNSAVRSAPFEIVGRERFSLITGLSKNSSKIKREAATVRKLSAIFSSRGFFVAKRSKQQSIEGVPVLLESELPEINSAKELNKLIEEKL